MSYLLSWKGPGSGGYARAGKDKTLTMQAQVARTLRNRLGQDDPIGEHTYLSDLKAHLGKREVPEDEINRIVKAMTTFLGPTIREVLWPTVDGSGMRSSSSKQSGAVSSRMAEGPERQTAPEQQEDIPEGYIISISAKKGLRRLHLMGACHRIPGLDYAEYEAVGDTCPASDRYDDYCRHCWRGDAQPSAEGQGDDMSQASVGSDSESSSSASA